MQGTIFHTVQAITRLEQVHAHGVTSTREGDGYIVWADGRPALAWHPSTGWVVDAWLAERVSVVLMACGRLASTDHSVQAVRRITLASPERSEPNTSEMAPSSEGVSGT